MHKYKLYVHGINGSLQIRCAQSACSNYKQLRKGNIIANIGAQNAINLRQSVKSETVWMQQVFICAAYARHPSSLQCAVAVFVQRLPLIRVTNASVENLSLNSMILLERGFS